MSEKIFLTIGRSIQLEIPQGSSNEALTWRSSTPSVISVNNEGIATALAFSESALNLRETFVNVPATESVTITARNSSGIIASFELIATNSGSENILDAPSLKNMFAEYFLIGNIVRDPSRETSGSGGSARVTNEVLTRHFNALTAENNMKPDSLSAGRNQAAGTIAFNWERADAFVNAAYNDGFKVIGHTLLWHSQIPSWQRDMAGQSRETALTAMRQWITEIASRYSGKIYSWDVLNEVFPDGLSSNADWRTSMRGTGDSQSANPWFVSIGADFVFEGFLVARLADPHAILYYNDYNTDQPSKARVIANMVRDVNDQWRRDPRFDGRLLIEGIGMQEHHNTNVTANAVRTTINLFRPLGVKIAVTELDILGQNWSEFSSSGRSGTNRHLQSTVTNQGLLNQARLYGQLFDIYIENKDIIERISIWGITDDSSWRSGGLPLLFDHNGTAKPSFYEIANRVR